MTESSSVKIVFIIVMIFSLPFRFLFIDSIFLSAGGRERLHLSFWTSSPLSIVGTILIQGLELIQALTVQLTKSIQLKSTRVNPKRCCVKLIIFFFKERFPLNTEASKEKLLAIIFYSRPIENNAEIS